MLENLKQKINFRKVFGVDAPAIRGLSEDELGGHSESILNAMEQLLTLADSEARELTDDEKSAFSYGESVIHEIEEARAKGAAKLPRGLLDNKVSPDGVDAPRKDKPGIGFIKPTYRELFCPERPTGKLGNGEFKNMNEFFSVLASGRYDPRLEARDQMIGVGSIGGAVVPNDFAEIIWSMPLEESIVMSRAKIFPIRTGTSITIPQLDGLDHSSNIGGLSLRFEAEGGTASDQEAQFSDIEVTAYWAAIYAAASNKLLRSGIDFASQLGEAMRNALVFGTDEVLLGGSGVGRPLGIRNAPSRITVDRATANEISYADILNMFSRLHPGCVRNACWMASPSAIPQLCTLKDSANNNLWVVNASAGMPPTILNIPVVFSEKIPGLGNEADLVLCDPSQLAVAIKQDILAERVEGPRWYQNMTNFRISIQIGATPLWKTVCTPANGGASLSWAIVLR